MSWRKTKAVLDAIKTTLEGLVFPVGDPFEGDPVFKSVRLYDTTNLGKALDDLLEFNDRICLVIDAGDTWRNEQVGTALESRRRGNVVLVMSDQDYAPGKGSYFGDASHPGIINLKENVLAAIPGEKIGIKGCVLEPEDGEGLRFAKDENSLDSSREGYRLFLSFNMGTENLNLTRGTSGRYS